MDLKQIETFVHVAEFGSFTRAAGFMRIAQPALSRQVRALEVELRQSLFERNGRGVTLTEPGKRLLVHGRAILLQIERARQDLEAHRGAPVGRLAIGLPPSVGRSLTGPLVHAFRQRFPQATLTMVEGLSTYVLEWLVQGRIDCAVAYDVAPSGSLDLLPVLEEPLYLVSARSGGAGTRQEGRPPGVEHAVRIGPGTASLAELAQTPLVIPSRPHAIRMRVETALAGATLKPRVALEIESVPAILDLVLHQGLHAVLGLNALRGHPSADAFAVRPVVQGRDRHPLAATLWIATAAQRPQGPLLEQSLPLLTDLLRAPQGSAGGPAAAPPPGLTSGQTASPAPPTGRRGRTPKRSG
jgi:LysR family transcriptional regulator, nitrogen assimilation regulatory protein